MYDSSSGGNEDTIRVLVAGNSGAGKTRLVHALCAGSTTTTVPPRTIGAEFSVMRVVVDSAPVFVELVDVGGHDRFKLSRHVFYHHLDAVVLVYSASNSKSYTNLQRWIAELRSAERMGREVVRPGNYHSHVRENRVRGRPGREGDAGSRLWCLPIFVVGTHRDALRRARWSAHGPNRPHQPPPLLSNLRHVLTDSATPTRTDGGEGWVLDLVASVLDRRRAAHDERATEGLYRLRGVRSRASSGSTLATVVNRVEANELLHTDDRLEDIVNTEPGVHGFFRRVHSWVWGGQRHSRADRTGILSGVLATLGRWAGVSTARVEDARLGDLFGTADV